MNNHTVTDNPKLYTKAKLSQDGIVMIEYLKAIPDSICDLRVTEYLADFVDQAATSKSFNKKIFVDLEGYQRDDCPSIFGMSYPTLMARRKHMESTDKQGIVKIAFHKKNINPCIKSLMDIAVAFKTCKKSLFIDKKEAIEWLKKD